MIHKGNPFKDKKSDLIVEIGAGLTSVSSERREHGKLYASDAGICQRRGALYWINDDEPSIWLAKSSLYTTVGNAIHAKVRDALYARNKLLFGEIKLPDLEINLSGYADAIILDQEVIKVLEIKTCGAIPPKPSISHFAQATIYSSILGIPATILYVSRNIANYRGELIMQQYEVSPTPEQRRSIMMNVFVAAFSATTNVPPIPFESDSICKDTYCPFIMSCWNAHYPELSISEYETIKKNSEQYYIEIANKMKFRRNGVLKHIATYGNEIAKRLLSGNWDLLLEDIAYV